MKQEWTEAGCSLEMLAGEGHPKHMLCKCMTPGSQEGAPPAVSCRNVDESICHREEHELEPCTYIDSSRSCGHHAACSTDSMNTSAFR